MILHSFFTTLSQIGDPRFRRVLLLGIALTVALLVGATAGFLWFINWLTADSFDVPLIGNITWFDDVLSVGGVLVMMVLSVFLMVPVASAITSMFLDEVAIAVEDRHYPHLPRVDSAPFGDALRDTINFLGVIIAANILALIVYAIVPFGSVFIFWALNGFLLGREYFTLAAMRRLGRRGAKEMRSRHSGTIWLAGVLMAIPLSVPLLNLLIPILGAATFTHLFHQITQAEARGQKSPYHPD